MQEHAMQVYISDIQAEEEGHSYGKWLPLPLSSDELMREKNSLLAVGEYLNSSKNHQKIAVADIEGFPFEYYEGISLETLNHTAHKLSKLSTENITAIRLILQNNIVDNIEAALQLQNNMICTAENDMENVAKNHIKQSYNLKSMMGKMSKYFDYKALAHDLENGGEYYRDTQGIIWRYNSENYMLFLGLKAFKSSSIMFINGGLILILGYLLASGK
jgi:antirestriction protein